MDLKALIEDVVASYSSDEYDNSFVLIRDDDGTWQARIGARNSVDIGEWSEFESGYRVTPEEAIADLKTIVTTADTIRAREKEEREARLREPNLSGITFTTIRAEDITTGAIIAPIIAPNIKVRES